MTTQDHYTRLGLPRRFVVDAAALERAYLAQSRAVHPDFHAVGSGGDLAASTELSAAVNEAYNTLKEPFARAEYLLALHGGPSASEEKAVPPALLAGMMEFRERAEEGNAAERAAVRDELRERVRGLEGSVAAGFGAYDNLPGDDPERPRVLHAIRRGLNAWKTTRSLLRTLADD
ncbi:Fe-S protein assembly co-chaperone HscB [bacterium]|nr:Fe-S protein assembly co-chaperone HscB [bacterium]